MLCGLFQNLLVATQPTEILIDWQKVGFVSFLIVMALLLLALSGISRLIEDIKQGKD